jgi:hypothetical protein
MPDLNPLSTPNRASWLSPAVLKPALAAALLSALLVLALSLAHGGNVSALMMLPDDGPCPRALGVPKGVVVFTEEGYDGYLYYYIARDLSLVHGCAGGKRYQRILYPLLVWLLALGRDSLIPLMMSLVNVLAIGAGTWLMAVWLAELGRSPWLALFYGLSLGHVLVIQYALPGAVALLFSLAGAFAYLRRERVVLASALFTLALLARETSVLLLAPLTIWTLYKRRLKDMIVLGLALAPYLAWIGALWLRFGSLEMMESNISNVTPDLEGLRLFLSKIDFHSGLRELLRTASSLPYLGFVLLCLGLGAWRLPKSGSDQERLWSWMLVFISLASLILAEGMWGFISCIGRVTLCLVPAAILFAVQREDRPGKLLLASLGGLYLMALARVYLAGVHNYFVQG